MAIRIDIDSEGPVVVVHVAGRLTGLAIKELKDVCERMEGDFVMNLSKLKFVDEAGAEVIRNYRGEGATVRGASYFIKLLINNGSAQKFNGI